mmetsp:Transcript_18587/g.37401  ORF Transcript_18587/g.37401 Transcript_18587/m.37401 type:complete len:84 (-) Transcript_18587:366-617(-)
MASPTRSSGANWVIKLCKGAKTTIERGTEIPTMGTSHMTGATRSKTGKDNNTPVIGTSTLNILSALNRFDSSPTTTKLGRSKA